MWRIQKRIECRLLTSSPQGLPYELFLSQSQLDSIMDEKAQTAGHIERYETPPDEERKSTPLKADEIANAKLSTFISNNVDYSGASGKTDPAEIKLVRKLDTWIMPM